MFRYYKKTFPLIPALFRRSVKTMNKLTVRRVEGEERMTLSFTFSSPLVKERRFNFDRRQNELVSTALERIAKNIGNVGEKKLRKLRKKKSSDGDPGEPSTDSATDMVETAEPLVNLTMNGANVIGETPAVVGFQSGAVLRVGDTEFQVEVNPPLITKLSLGKQLMAGYAIHPKLELEHAKRKKCKLMWFHSISRFHDEGQVDVNRLDWEFVREGLIYKPGEEDIGRYLKVKCIPVDEGGREGSTIETVSKEEVGAGPGETPFHRRHVFTDKFTQPGSFRVVSYNILANLYADSDYSRTHLFPACPPYALDIDYRKQLMLEEICGYKPDIVCLQEVDNKIFDKFLSMALEDENMEGKMASKGGNVGEGSACFYRKDKFRLINHTNVELSKLVTDGGDNYADILSAVNSKEKLGAAFLERKTILQVTILEPTDVVNQPLLCVANTHLYFKPNADHIRLLQAGVCLRYLQLLMKEEKRPMSLVFCGDFNSTPESGVLELMTTRIIAEDHERWRTTPEEEVTGLSLTHDFDLMCASGTPEFTNYTSDFRGCLDYVFADQQRLEVEEVVPLPSCEELSQHEALPSIVMPSDHIAVVCTLKWKI